MNAHKTILINSGKRHAIQNMQSKQRERWPTAQISEIRECYKNSINKFYFCFAPAPLPAPTQFSKRYLIPTFKKNFGVFLSVHSGISPISLE